MMHIAAAGANNGKLLPRSAVSSLFHYFQKTTEIPFHVHHSTLLCSDFQCGCVTVKPAVEQAITVIYEGSAVAGCDHLVCHLLRHNRRCGLAKSRRAPRSVHPVCAAFRLPLLDE